ncbi:MAG TPA: gamma-glutamyltransferase [Gaiellaceae bacterium]|nr:gamma-glutamyltransferase [Gaiellaceae bacterium]
MKGAVAAGHPLTARAGARVLEEGGNAVDACVAAVFAGAVCESFLTSPAAGGFMLVHRARDRTSRLADFFVSAPGLGLKRPRSGKMETIDVGFGDSGTTQPFLIGPATVAVPGAVAGLEAAHRAYGRLPWRELLVPAIELARGGVELTRSQAHMHGLLDPILRYGHEARRIYSNPSGARLVAGETLRLPDLADTLDAVARKGSAALYRGSRARAIVATVREGGGDLTLADLAAYRVVWRRPVRVPFHGHEILSNPPPSSGGVLIAYGLALLGRLPAAAAGSAEAVAALAEVMREQGRARGDGFARGLQRGGLAGRLLAPASLRAARRRIDRKLGGVWEAAPPGGTTHVSAIDRDGNAAAVSTSTGSGSGVVVPGTGIYLNNMLGEFDLVGGVTPPPGSRLTSMMAPTIAVGRDGSPRLVVGSAGSARLRGAIMQIVVNVLEHGLGVEAAINAPRIHVDEPYVHCEGGHDPAELDRLAELGYDVVRWRRRNLFFGGAAAVEMLAGGGAAAAGDPRRGGAGALVG